MKTHRFRNSSIFKASACMAALLITSTTQALEVSSSTLKDGAVLTQRQVFNGFGCSGENLSPTISWRDAPAGTKSFGVTLYDPDAPTGSGWWHWVVFNIPADVTGLPEGAGASGGEKLPKGAVQSRTDFGSEAFGGACPPLGDKPHRYQLTLYALDTAEIPLDASATAAMVGFFLNQHALAKDQLNWTYGRDN